MNARLRVTDLDGPVRMLAGPGTGKTQLLVDLYTELVAGGHAGRGEILVLTFSTAAASEIARRVDERLRDSYDRAWISTFHSFCARLLREHRPDPRRTLMNGFQEQVAMRQVLLEMDPAHLGLLAAVSNSAAFVQDALAFVALIKQNRVHPAELSLLAEVSGTERLRGLATIYAAYQARIESAGLCDFRDLVSDAIGLLDARPDVLGSLQRRFRHVLIDEFQDVDPAQFHLLRTLAPPAAQPNLLVVGDPDQAIYGFRGTVPSLLSEDFGRVYGGSSLHMDQSRRCPPSVLEAAGRVLDATQPQVHQVLSADGSGPARAVQVVGEATGIDEATFVAREIKRLLLERPELQPAGIAVLLRSTSVQSGPFEEAIRALGVPYEVVGVGSLGRNEVVRFLLTYLRALHDPQADDAMERLLGSGLSGVGHRAAGRLRRHAVEEGRAFPKVVRRLLHCLHDEDPEAYPLPWAPGDDAQAGATPAEGEQRRPPDFLPYLSAGERRAIHAAVAAYYGLRRRARHLPLRALAYAVLLEAGVMERLLRLQVEEPERDRALHDLRAALDAFEDLEAVWERLLGARPLLGDVAPQLETWITRALDEAEPASGRGAGVQIMTVHQSKGLEFDAVFLSGFARGLLPLTARPHPILEEEDQPWLERHLQGFRPSWASDGAAHTAEEARLAYVGMTRSRGLLYLTFADEYDEPAGPSPFLELAMLEASGRQRHSDGGPMEPGSVLTLAEAETLLVGQALEGPARRQLAGLGIDLDWVADPQAGQPFRPYLERPQHVDPGHFSPTTINDYLRCPRLYFYNAHPGVAAPPRTVELERGSFLHRVLEDFHSREAEWRTLASELQRDWLEAALAPHLTAYLDRVENVLDRKAEEQEVRRILSNYIEFATRWQPIRRMGTLVTEKKFFLDVEGSQIRGKIDRIIDTGDGTCEVVDYKTGRGLGIERTYERYFGSELYDVQLAMYYLACQEGVDADGNRIGLQPRFLSLWFPKDRVYGSIRQSLFPVGGTVPGVPDRQQHPVDDPDLARGRERVAEAIRRIRAGDFAPAPRADTPGTCLSWVGCAHAAICPYGGQPEE